MNDDTTELRVSNNSVGWIGCHDDSVRVLAADLATLREKAAEADELRKRAERMQKALSDIAEWTDRYTTPGHPVSTISRAAIAQGKGE